MSKTPSKSEITSLSLDDLNVEELEARIELAAHSADCDCNGSGGNGNTCGQATCKPQ